MIHYSTLLGKYKDIKPYRNANQIPWGMRHHRHKFFEAVEVNGKLEFHLSYYWGWEQETLEMAEYEYLKQFMNKREKNKWSLNDYSWNESKIPYWTKYKRLVNPFCIVRDDNTMEFICDDMHQGLRMIISDHLPRGYYIQQEKSSGGVVMKEMFNKMKMPIFKGLRLHMDTFEPHESSRYRVEIRNVDRKKANEIHKGDKEKYALLKSFYASMETKDLGADIKEVRDEYYPDGMGWQARLDAQEKANELWATNPMKASYLYLLGYNILDTRWAGGYNVDLRYHNMHYHQHVVRLIRKNQVIKHNAFTTNTYWDFDKNYPTSNWKMHIIKKIGRAHV